MLFWLFRVYCKSLYEMGPVQVSQDFMGNALRDLKEELAGEPLLNYI